MSWRERIPGARIYGSGWLQAKKGRSFNDRFSMAGTSCYSYCIGIVVVSSKTSSFNILSNIKMKKKASIFRERT